MLLALVKVGMCRGWTDGAMASKIVLHNSWWSVRSLGNNCTIGQRANVVLQYLFCPPLLRPLASTCLLVPLGAHMISNDIACMSSPVARESSLAQYTCRLSGEFFPRSSGGRTLARSWESSAEWRMRPLHATQQLHL